MRFKFKVHSDLYGKGMWSTLTVESDTLENAQKLVKQLVKGTDYPYVGNLISSSK